MTQKRCLNEELFSDESTRMTMAGDKDFEVTYPHLFGVVGIRDMAA